MSKAIHLKQWKSAGRRFPCCKTDDGQYTYKRRNKKLRRFVKVRLMQERYDD